MSSKKINSISPLLKGETKSLTGLTTKNPFKDLFNYSFFYSLDLEFYKRDEINKITYLNGILGIKDKELKEGKDDMLNKIMERLDQMDKTMIGMNERMNVGFAEIHNKVDAGFSEIHKRIDYVENKVDNIDKKVNDGFSEIHNKVNIGFENINNRLDIIEKNVINLNNEVFGKKELMK